MLRFQDLESQPNSVRRLHGCSWTLCCLLSVLVNHVAALPWRSRYVERLRARQRRLLPLSELREFSTAGYKEMVADTARTASYEMALREIVSKEDVVVDIGTGPFALLARQAARAGARRVFAIEANHDVAVSARQFLKASQDSESKQIELIEGISANVTLPLAADIAVHEILGEIASREGAAAIIRDAFARHVVRSPRALAGTWSVPCRARSWLVPVEMPTNEQLRARPQRGSKHVLMLPTPKDAFLLRFNDFPFAVCAVAHPQCFEILDFARVGLNPMALTGKQKRRLKFICDRPGILAGFAIFITAELTARAASDADAAETSDAASCCYYSRDNAPPGIGFCSAWLNTHWGNPLVCLKSGSGNSARVANVDRGDILEVDTVVDLSPFQPEYMVHAALQRFAAAAVPKETLLNITFK